MASGASRKGSAGTTKEPDGAGTNGLLAPEPEALAPYDELADELQRVTVSEQKEREAAVCACPLNSVLLFYSYPYTLFFT